MLVRFGPLLLARIFLLVIAVIAGLDLKHGFGKDPQPVRRVDAPSLGNYPNTSISLSAGTTITPSLAPANTANITISGSTDFKGKLEGSPVSGVVRVTNAHPAGVYTITVTAFDSNGVTASATFTLAVTTPQTCLPVIFAAPTTFSAVFAPFSVVVGDFNGDGKQDLAVPNNLAVNNVSILLGNGTGSFAPATNFAVGTNPISVAVGDFNGDGKEDLAVANYGSNNVSILLGNGAGSFSSPTNFAAGPSPSSIAVGDFNGDAKQDLAVANDNSSNISILLGDGAGNFSSPTTVSVGTNPNSVAVGDFNGDGKQDLAVANFTSNNVSILLGDGAGNFMSLGVLGPNNGPRGVTVGDFNGDGIQDLVIVNGLSNNVSVVLGNGAGNFSSATNFGVGTGPWIAAVGDFNGDGKQDLAVANFQSNNVSMLLGNGMGGFSAATTLDLGANTHPISVAVGDFNGDGKQDLAAANEGVGTVSILLRKCVPNPTSVVSRKTHGNAGPFDINLPSMGSVGVECRDGGANGNYQTLFTFANAVSVSGASVTGGPGRVDSFSAAGNVVTVNLSGVSNGAVITIVLTNVNDGTNNGDVSVRMAVLVGDTNQDRSVNSADISQAKSQSGNALDNSNFREDVNVDGSINSADISVVKANSGNALP